MLSVLYVITWGVMVKCVSCILNLPPLVLDVLDFIITCKMVTCDSCTLVSKLQVDVWQISAQVPILRCVCSRQYLGLICAVALFSLRYDQKGGRPWCSTGGPPSQLKRQAFLRLAGASPSSKDSTTASVASASSEAATVRAPTALDAASRSPFTDSRAST